MLKRDLCVGDTLVFGKTLENMKFKVAAFPNGMLKKDELFHGNINFDGL